MVGRAVDLTVTRSAPDLGDTVLHVEDLRVLDATDAEVVHGVDLDVRAGEIVALAGVEGNGQTPFVRAITGLDPTFAGTIEISGRSISGASRKEVLRHGVGHVPEDRTTDGLVAGFSIAENLALSLWDAPPFANRGALDFRAMEQHAEEQVRLFDIRTPSIHTPAGSLSGGNQQKVVVAREFHGDIDLLVASQPTRGVDVGSIENIHASLVAKRDEGTAVLLVSSELDEVLALADRVAVMFRGELFGPFDTPISKDAVGLMMAGTSPDVALEKGA
jgi:general nucleoside transport system ATP-binding protein